MVHLFVSISRFTLIIMFAIYTYDCFAALKRKTSESVRTGFTIGRTGFSI